MEKIELKDKLSEMMKEIGGLTNYQDIGARKSAARGIMLYLVKEIHNMVETQDAGEIEYVIDGNDNFEVEEIFDLINII